jgi:dienelactone hydrolase
MARAGADLDAVASFHGSIGTDTPAEKGKVKAQVLVLTGAADPFVPEEQVAAFESEMKNAGVRCQVIRYPGAKHGFTNPDAGTYGMEQLQYDADADAKSWDAMLKFFRKALK